MKRRTEITIVTENFHFGDNAVSLDQAVIGPVIVAEIKRIVAESILQPSEVNLAAWDDAVSPHKIRILALGGKKDDGFTEIGIG